MFDFLSRIAGFTGTSRGMTIDQKLLFRHAIIEFNPKEFHHGDCVGADEEAHKIVRSALPKCVIVIHPPRNKKMRAFCVGDRMMPEGEYLNRNRNIVRPCTKLFVVPFEAEEQLRSGTWSTMRFAYKLQKEIHLILPKG